MRARCVVTILAGLASIPAFADDRCGQTGSTSAPVTLAYEVAQNPPRTVGEGTSIDWQRPGLSIELLCLAATQIGAAIEFKRVPWSRGLHLLEFNQIDGLFHASFTAERQAIAVYPTQDGNPDPSRAIFVQSYYLYVGPHSSVQWDGKVLTGLDGKAVGIARGYAIGKELAAQGIALDEETTAIGNFRKLAAGRVGAVAELEGIADRALRELPEASSIAKLPIPLRTQPYYLLLSRGFVSEQPAQGERLWDAIRTVNASAAYAAVRAKYEQPQ